MPLIFRLHPRTGQITKSFVRYKTKPVAVKVVSPTVPNGYESRLNHLRNRNEVPPRSPS